MFFAFLCGTILISMLFQWHFTPIYSPKSIHQPTHKTQKGHDTFDPKGLWCLKTSLSFSTDCEQIHLFSGGVLLQHGEDRYDSYEEGYEDYDGEKGAFYDCVWPLPAPSQHASSLTLLNVSFPDGEY